MSDNPTGIAERRASDATTPDPTGEFTLDEFFRAMQRSRRERPRFVELLVHPEQLGLRDEVIRLVVTDIRQVWVEPDPGEEQFYYRYPDYEVEGWLYVPHGQPMDEIIWVRCALRMDDLEVQEIQVCRLDPGEERGVAWAPEFSY